jgi:hypothetical protein
MKVRMPAVAPMTPPDMGASMKVASVRAARAATRREVEGSMVEWSMSRRVAERAGRGEERIEV